MNKTKMAKTLGISRPTLDKRIKDGQSPIVDGIVSNEMMQKCIQLSGWVDARPSEIDAMLEFMADHRMLTGDGIKFATIFWKLFIKE